MLDLQFYILKLTKLIYESNNKFDSLSFRKNFLFNLG